ncbi:SpoIIE family protein phosphatase [Embleya sp. NBC_00896]|nr:SpoIIE family protein phosphatase [Embleya sp. NBC_00896]
MPTVTEQVLASAGVAMVAVYMVDEEAQGLRLTETVGESSGAAYGLWPWYALSGGSPVADAFRAGRPLWLSSAETAAPGGGAGVPAAGASLGALPLDVDGRRLGCLVVVDRTGDGFDAQRRGLLELYAGQVAVRVEAGCAASGGSESGGGLAGASGGSTDHGRVQPDLPSGLSGGAAGGGAVGGADGTAAVGRRRSETRLAPALDGDRAGSFTLVLSTGRIQADEHVLDLVGIAPDDFDGRVETLLAHTVPEDLPALMSVVEPGHAMPGGRELEFRIRRSTGELRWLRLRCRVLLDPSGRPDRLLGVLVDASHLRSSTDEVSMVQRLSALLATALAVRDVGRSLVTALREPLGADRLALAQLHGGRLVVTVLDPPEPTAWPENWRSEWRPERPDALTGALPTLTAALRDGTTCLWATSTGLEPGLDGLGRGGLAVLPLPYGNRVVGLCLLGWDKPHRFGTEERSLLTATAGLVGQALVRARAFDAEHELAAMLQRSLLPRKLPSLPGCVTVARYLPATAGLAVGGDWYDVIPLSDRFVALVIGDVQGHSAEAATVMGQIRTAIRAYAVEGHPPDVVVSHTNRLLAGMETDAFATCCYVALDTEEGEAWFVRAGHMLPVVREPDGTTREVETEGGPPLGVLPDAEFPLTTAPLPPGSVLTLLTDGLVESSKLLLEDGVRRVCETLSAADPSDVDRMADELIRGAEARDDDVALLLMRYDGLTARPRRAGWAVWRLPDAIMHARRFTARTMRAWQVTEETDAILLIVSELVTNAVAHTQGEVRLDLTLAGDRLRVAVSDSSPRAPVKPASVDWEVTGGRGLLLVEAMSEAWGSVPLSGGKQVWGEVLLPPRGA